MREQTLTPKMVAKLIFEAQEIGWDFELDGENLKLKKLGANSQPVPPEMRELIKENKQDVINYLSSPKNEEEFVSKVMKTFEGSVVIDSKELPLYEMKARFLSLAKQAYPTLSPTERFVEMAKAVSKIDSNEARWMAAHLEHMSYEDILENLK